MRCWKRKRFRRYIQIHLIFLRVIQRYVTGKTWVSLCGKNNPNYGTTSSNDSRQSALTYLRMPSTQSSMNMKERVCSPSPHISNSLELTMALRQKAAGAFSLPPFQVPKGPYTLWKRAIRVCVYHEISCQLRLVLTFLPIFYQSDL